jgi:cytoskeletal protein CcmA (bactofilin family)
MFTFKPAPKNDSNGNGQKNTNANGHSGANGNGPAHAPAGDMAGHASPPAAEPAQPAGARRATGLTGWLGLGGNGHGRAPAARPAARHHPTKVESVVGAGLHQQGTLTGDGGIRIEGSFDGIINITGPLVIADGAKVTADIRAGAVSVAGSVKGNITAGKVEILSTGRVWGDLITTAFATEEGAFLRGQVRMEDELPERLPAPAAPPTAAFSTAPSPALVREPERRRF